MIIVQGNNRMYLRRLEKTTGLISEKLFPKDVFTGFLRPSIKKNNSNEKYNYFFLKFIDKRSQDREILTVFKKPTALTNRDIQVEERFLYIGSYLIEKMFSFR